MVIKDKEKKIYYCKECKLAYRKLATAKKCEEWCKNHKSCNLDIIRYAIK
ncbi:MAG: hypothetical protein AABW83_01890 [Nanoarchaeota archaeon]